MNTSLCLTSDISKKDVVILRDLAKRVLEISALPEQAEKVRLWTVCNNLKPERPMVLADPQMGWKELEKAWIKLECENNILRNWEYILRSKIVRHEHIPDDFPILKTFHIYVSISGDTYNDYGVELGVTRSSQEDGAYHIEPAIKSDKDLEKLHQRNIHIDHKSTDHEVKIAEDIFGDILEVRKTGKVSWRYGLTRILIHMRGLDQMMLDMYDNPELMHRLMRFFRDDFLQEIDLFEKDKAVELNNNSDFLNGTGGLNLTNDLPGNDFNGIAKAKHCICWGESQETVSISAKQFEEFVLKYQLPIFKQFGMVAYGCCEPLDNKLDLLIKNIPNLRLVAVSPWSNREIAAEKIGKNYVYVYKPNPSYICLVNPDWDAAEKQIRDTIKIAKGCPMHIVMKDTHTFCNEPNRITKWAEIASRIVLEG